MEWFENTNDEGQKVWRQEVSVGKEHLFKLSVTELGSQKMEIVFVSDYGGVIDKVLENTTKEAAMIVLLLEALDVTQRDINCLKLHRQRLNDTAFSLLPNRTLKDEIKRLFYFEKPPNNVAEIHALITVPALTHEIASAIRQLAEEGVLEFRSTKIVLKENNENNQD